jgi:hypothetical protein
MLRFKLSELDTGHSDLREVSGGVPSLVEYQFQLLAARGLCSSIV